MKKIKLSVQDRIFIQLFIPAMGGRIKMILAQNLLDAFQFTVEEITKFGIKDNLPQNATSWTGSEDVEFDLSPEQIQLLTEGMDMADKENRIYMAMIPLCEKIDNLTK